MRVDNTKDKDKKKKKKRQQSILEKEIMSIMHKSMKAALDMALDDLLKDWKESAAAVASKSQNPRVGDS